MQFECRSSDGPLDVVMILLTDDPQLPIFRGRIKTGPAKTDIDSATVLMKRVQSAADSLVMAGMTESGSANGVRTVSKNPRP